MGICGTAMGNIAVMMKAIGHEICGTDTAVYEPMKGVLERAGIEIFDGWSAARLKALKPDLVVVGNVVSRMNPEIEYLWESREFPITSLAELIGNQIIATRPALVVSGTHGKTTTTSIAAYLLSKFAPNTGWMVGGVPKDLPGGSNYGDASSPFVIEGDEYDTAFFDKRSKFIHYRPKVLLINNIEFDHADIFRDLTDVKRTFTHVRRVVSGSGMIIENGDDANIASLEDTPWVKRIKVGFAPNCDLRISDFKQSADFASFKLTYAGKEKSVKWSMQGEYNARNAAMAIAGVAKILGYENLLDLDISSLENFSGIARRQEVILDNAKVCIVEDFGHHPTAIKGTIESLKQKYAGVKISACFEPRSNTAKTNIFEDDFAASLNLADKVYIGAAPKLSKTSTSKPIDTKKMAQNYGSKFSAFETNESLYEKLCSDILASKEKELIVFFSNGSFDGIHKRAVLKFKD